jgi:hypothetical protein
MRRKFPGKKSNSQRKQEATAPIASTMPPRPKDLKRAQGELQEALLGRSAHVATGFGFGDDPGDRTGAWRLYVFSDVPVEELPLPSEVMGFPVSRRPVPVALSHA